jgi:hypothetical protein
MRIVWQCRNASFCAAYKLTRLIRVPSIFSLQFIPNHHNRSMRKTSVQLDCNVWCHRLYPVSQVMSLVILQLWGLVMMKETCFAWTWWWRQWRPASFRDATRKGQQYCRLFRRSKSNLEAEWAAELVWMFYGKIVSEILGFRRADVENGVFWVVKLERGVNYNPLFSTATQKTRIVKKVSCPCMESNHNSSVVTCNVIRTPSRCIRFIYPVGFYQRNVTKTDASVMLYLWS